VISELQRYIGINLFAPFKSDNYIIKLNFSEKEKNYFLTWQKEIIDIGKKNTFLT